MATLINQCSKPVKTKKFREKIWPLKPSFFDGYFIKVYSSVWGSRTIYLSD